MMGVWIAWFALERRRTPPYFCKILRICILVVFRRQTSFSKELRWLVPLNHRLAGRFSPFGFERHHAVSPFVLGDDGMVWLWIARADVTCPGLLSLYLFRL